MTAADGIVESIEVELTCLFQPYKYVWIGDEHIPGDGLTLESQQFLGRTVFGGAPFAERSVIARQPRPLNRTPNHSEDGTLFGEDRHLFGQPVTLGCFPRFAGPAAVKCLAEVGKDCLGLIL